MIRDNVSLHLPSAENILIFHNLKVVRELFKTERAKLFRADATLEKLPTIFLRRRATVKHPMPIFRIYIFLLISQILKQFV